MLSVSTKTGDKGTTGLANGQRLPKDALIFEVLGTQDELNSWIGVVIANLDSSFESHSKTLTEIQEVLFYIGAELAQSPTAKLNSKAVTRLETWSETLQTEMAEGWTTKFLFPGGHPIAAWLDVSRTVARKLERQVIRLSGEQTVSPLILQYLNRLSDYLYVLRCFVNQELAVDEKAFIVNSKRK